MTPGEKRLEDMRIEEEVANHMEENGFSEDQADEYCDWLDGYIQQH